MIQTAVFPGRYVQGEDALSLLASETSRLGDKALMISGRTAERTILPRYAAEWNKDLHLTAEHFHGECCDAEIERLQKTVAEHKCNVVIGLGGGKIIDTAKAVAHAAGAACVIAPTAASTDAPTSAVSVIYTPEGEFSRYLFLPRNPDLVLVDASVIAAAPVRFLVSGMGDALSTWLEADSCRQKYAANQCGGVGTLAAYAIARLCYDTILEYGEAAIAACRRQVVTPALAHVIEANTLHSGLGFESGGLASAHSIHNGLTMLPGTHDYYHGEKVAIGVLAGLFLADRPRRLIDEVYRFCETIGLPTTLSAIGLAEVSEADLLIVAGRACAEGETIYHEPRPVSPQSVVAALQAADEYGRKRRQLAD